MQQINVLHAEILGSLRLSVENAIQIGQLLIEQKAECAHGGWLPWLEKNVKFTARTATNYMRLFEHRDELKSANVSDLAEAYAVLLSQKLSDQSTEPEPDPATSWTAPDVGGGPELKPEPEPEPRTVESDIIETIEPDEQELMQRAEEQSRFKDKVISRPPQNPLLSRSGRGTVPKSRNRP